MTRYAPCPSCSSTDADAVEYTWWGGVLGPRLLTHVRCRSCGTFYNGKTGESNQGAIIAYSVALAATVCAMLWVYGTFVGTR